MAAAPPSCYHGAMSRKECETLLAKKNRDGAYLIRDSETIRGALCLCVYKQRMVYTYRLFKTNSGQYLIMTEVRQMEKYFDSLDDLLCHYEKRGQGLAIELRYPVKRRHNILSEPQKPPEMEEEEEADYENVPGSPDYVKVLPS